MLDNTRKTGGGGENTTSFAELSSREFRLLERLADHTHFTTRHRGVGGRAAVRQPGSKGKPIFTVRLRNLERAGLIQTERIYGRLAIVPSAAGAALVAERREARRRRLLVRPRGALDSDAPVKWWL
jgi:hypothetical protein